MPTLLLLFRRIEQPHLRPLREYYVQQLLSKVHLVHAIPPLMLVHSLQSDATELKQRVCNALTEGLFPLLAHTNATPLVRSWEEIAAYEALFAAVNFHDHCTLEQLLRTILTVGTAFSVFDASQLEGVAPSRHALSGLVWLPSIVLVRCSSDLVRVPRAAAYLTTSSVSIGIERVRCTVGSVSVSRVDPTRIVTNSLERVPTV